MSSDSKTEHASLPQTDVERDPLDLLAEDFAERCRQGESPSVEEYVESHPDLADELRELLPSVVMMEELRLHKLAETSTSNISNFNETIEQLGDFRIIREVGRGGMGIVYEAEQLSLGRHVALKVLPKGSLPTGEQVERFKREAQAAASLHHTNIVPVFGVGEQEGHNYYVMQFIKGPTLHEIVEELFKSTKKKPLASETVPAETVSPSDETVSISEAYRSERGYWRQVAVIGLQVAEALQYAHGQGTLHRDIKPANLILDDGGTVWVTDFGLAKLIEQDDLTKSGDVVGTLRYMAPEQFKGEFDERSDLCGLGLTLYELLALRPAYDQPDRGHLIRQIIHQEPPSPRKVNPQIPIDLETIVLKAMARESHRRYRTASELADDLQRFLDGRPVKARPVTHLGRLRLWCRRNPALSTLSALALSFLIIAISLLWSDYVKTARALKIQSQQNKETKEQAARAEANLELAMAAFEEIFTQVKQDETEPSPEVAAILQNLLKFYDRFIERNGNNPALQLETARGNQRVGLIQIRLGNFGLAEAACREALRVYAILAVDNPENSSFLIEVATVHDELGLALFMNGKQQEATESFNEGFSIFRYLAERSLNSEKASFVQARSRLRFGLLLRQERKSESAITQFLLASEILKKLVDAYPGEAVYRRYLDQVLQILATENRVER